MKKDTLVTFYVSGGISAFIILCISAAFSIHLATEVPITAYHNVNKMAEKHPSIKPVINKRLDDDKLTFGELDEIREAYRRAEIREITAPARK